MCHKLNQQCINVLNVVIARVQVAEKYNLAGVYIGKFEQTWYINLVLLKLGMCLPLYFLHQITVPGNLIFHLQLTTTCSYPIAFLHTENYSVLRSSEQETNVIAMTCDLIATLKNIYINVGYYFFYEKTNNF